MNKFIHGVNSTISGKNINKNIKKRYPRRLLALYLILKYKRLSYIHYSWPNDHVWISSKTLISYIMKGLTYSTNTKKKFLKIYSIFCLFTDLNSKGKICNAIINRFKLIRNKRKISCLNCKLGKFTIFLK